MDYNRNECQALVDNSEDNLFNLRSSSGVSYFEAICLKGWFFSGGLKDKFLGHPRVKI